MGRYVFKLPDVGEGTAEAELVAWHVKVGDTVEEDQLLVDVMTDKATVELTSPVAGVVTETNGSPGVMAPVGSPLVVFEVEGAGNVKGDAAASSLPRSGEGQAGAAGQGGGGASPVLQPAPDTTPELEAGEAPPPKPARGHAPTPAAARPVAPQKGAGGTPAFATRTPGDKPLASPAVRKRALDLGIKLQFVPGTAAAGRITHEDLDAYMANPDGGSGVPAGGRSSLYAQRTGLEEVRVIGLRRKIAEKMQEAKRRIPHFMYAEEIDATELEALRLHLNVAKKPGQPKLTLLPFFVRALVKVLPEHPSINAIYDDDNGVLHRHEAVHVGIATQTPNGLMVPVVRHAESMDVWQVADEIARVSGAAKSGKAAREELSGSTITVTSLGPLGGVVHTPVINHPEVAIVGPNKIIDRPVVRGGVVVVRKMMNLSSSFDHRIVDGYDAAEFIQKIKGLLEHPATLFME